jgi:crotonobetainyl-CoA:carnitine CoA-transferase CaiB-like acyl-CoA transferase
MARDQLHDPHYQVRGYGDWVEQQGLGWMSFEGPAFRATGIASTPTFQAPLVGEHTREIARDLLGLDSAEIDRNIADGILEVTE